MQTMSQHVMA